MATLGASDRSGRQRHGGRRIKILGRASELVMHLSQGF